MEPMRQIDFYRHGDYLDCYGSDALIVCKLLGLTRLTVHPQHATDRFPAGTSHTAIPMHCQEAWFETLKQNEWNPVVVS